MCGEAKIWREPCVEAQKVLITLYIYVYEQKNMRYRIKGKATKNL